MPREAITYRDNLERINERFPGNEMLRIKDVCDFTGSDYRIVIRVYPFNVEHKISKATLARYMSPPYPSLPK